MTGRPDLTLHATCVVIGEAGILIRGPSGAGKSTLALKLLTGVLARDGFVRLVADDRVALSARRGRLLARPVPPLEGLLEIRGRGLVRVDHEPACVVRLVVDLVADALRLPEAGDLVVEIVPGILLPRRPAPDPDRAVDMMAWHLRGRDDTMMTEL